MQFSRWLPFVAIALHCVITLSAEAQELPYAEERAAARRELHLAKIDLRNYWHIEFPRIRRHLNAQIDLTEAEIRIYKERLRSYRSFYRFSIGNPVAWSIRDLEMCLMEAELRLRDLWAERNNLNRFRTADWRDLELRVQDARLRVAQIERAIEIGTNEVELPAR